MSSPNMFRTCYRYLITNFDLSCPIFKIWVPLLWPIDAVSLSLNGRYWNELYAVHTPRLSGFSILCEVSAYHILLDAFPGTEIRVLGLQPVVHPHVYKAF